MSTRPTYSHIGRSDLDPVDHSILLRRLELSYGFRGCVLAWFTSYVDGRTYLVLGPIQFLLYTADLIQLIQRNDLHPHLFADDTQILYILSVSSGHFSRYVCVQCMDIVASCMRSNRLSTQHHEERGAVMCDEPSATSEV